MMSDQAQLKSTRNEYVYEGLPEVPHEWGKKLKNDKGAHDYWYFLLIHVDLII